MSMGWYYCWDCTHYRKWHDTSNVLDCGHKVSQKYPSYNFNTDDQYEIWAENHDPTAPEVDSQTRIDPPGYREWQDEWDRWLKSTVNPKPAHPLQPPSLTTRNK